MRKSKGKREAWVVEKMTDEGWVLLPNTFRLSKCRALFDAKNLREMFRGKYRVMRYVAEDTVEAGL